MMDVWSLFDFEVIVMLGRHEYNFRLSNVAALVHVEQCNSELQSEEEEGQIDALRPLRRVVPAAVWRGQGTAVGRLREPACASSAATVSCEGGGAES